MWIDADIYYWLLYRKICKCVHIHIKFYFLANVKVSNYKAKTLHAHLWDWQTMRRFSLILSYLMRHISILICQYTKLSILGCFDWTSIEHAWILVSTRWGNGTLSKWNHNNTEGSLSWVFNFTLWWLFMATTIARFNLSWFLPLVLSQRKGLP